MNLLSEAEVIRVMVGEEQEADVVERMPELSELVLE
jgi:hypothetical protein